jgi:hypothetical protein
MTHPQHPLPLGARVELLATIAVLGTAQIPPGTRGRVVEQDAGRPEWYRVMFDGHSQAILVHQSWIRPVDA